MKPLNKIFTGIMCGVLSLNGALANDDCSNIAYRGAHPERCQYAKSGNNNLLYWGGGAIAVGGIAAIIGAMAGGGGGGGSSSNAGVTTVSTQHIRALNPTTIIRSGTAPDFTNTDLSSITSTREYTRNTDAYEDIQLAYSIARGYTGAGTKIAVFDTEMNSPVSHGTSVMAVASGPIAPNAVVEHHAIAYDVNDFKPYNEIATIINDTKNANVYNNSWNVAATTADQITSRAQLESKTSQAFIASLSNAATQHDAILVWAAGNDFGAQSGMISAAPRVVPELNGHFVNVVAWDGENNKLAEYSNMCGITQDYCITAPGTIKMPNGMPHSGTSFAAPVVSAAIAVIREAWPYLNAAQITDILFTTAADLGEAGVDAVYGHGMLDLESATRPVGQLSIAVSDDITQPLQTATISPQIAHNIKSENPTMAFFDEYGRAYQATISNHISARNRGLGFERMRGDDARTKINMGAIEFGFYRSDMLNGTGFLATDGETTTSYIESNKSFNIGDIELFARSQFGTARPVASSESMISEFSNIYTAAASVGLRGKDWSWSVGIPETIIRGNMNLHTATDRRATGELVYHDYKIDMATKPAIEYMVNWHFMTAGFVDNPYGNNEFYIFAKTKLRF